MNNLFQFRSHLTAALFCLTTTMMAQQSGTKKFPLTEEHWTAATGDVEFFQHRSTDAVRGDGYFEVILNDVEFSTGIIEYDVELVGNGFPGINFHLGPEGLNYEVYYLRHFGRPDPLRRTTMQYAAVMDGINLWDITDDYQAAATLHEARWNHVKLVISEHQLLAFVNDMTTPALRVPKLEGIFKNGGIKLTGDVIYANFEVVHGEVEGLPHGPGHDAAAADPNYITDWEMSAPLDFPIGRDVMMSVPYNPRVAIDSTLLNGATTWAPISAEHRAMINLTKVHGATDEATRRLVWLKTNIESNSTQEKLLRLGFSDEVWVFINGQPLHVDTNYYGAPSMKDPVGRCALDNSSFEVPLREGQNELLIGVSNFFFAWGIIARFDDNRGLRY